MTTLHPTGSLTPTFRDAWSAAEGAARAAAFFREAFDAEPDGVWAAPGRVNLIGEHVDYNGGPCLPIALPHRTYVALRRRHDDAVRLSSALAPDTVWTSPLAGIAPGAVSGWVAYAVGPAWSLGQSGHALGGFDAVDDTCVPLGSGLSSSAAIECAVAAGLSDVFGLGLTDDDAGRAALAAACVRAENEVAGAPTGGMDQAASLRATEGHALLLDTRDSSVRQIPFDLASHGLELLVVNTRAPHALVDGQYAARRSACHAAAARLGVATLGEVTDAAAALAALDDDVERRRVRHVLTEIGRVREFVALLETGRLREVGPILDASHASLRDDYEVSCPELDVAVGSAREAGAIGARMTGGGFGGSAIALIEAGTATEVARAVATAFAAAGFREPEFLIALAGPPAGRVHTGEER